MQRFPLTVSARSPSSARFFATAAGLALACAAWTAPLAAKTAVELDKGTGSVKFTATGNPSALTINGEGDAPKGRFEIDGTKLTGQAKFDLKSLQTGLSLRDRHMRDKYLEVEKFPEATLALKKVTWPADKQTGDFEAKGPFEGELTLHGVTKPVQGQATLTRSGAQLKTDTEFTIKLTDFSIAVPSFAEITVADMVKVQVVTSGPVTP